VNVTVRVGRLRAGLPGIAGLPGVLVILAAIACAVTLATVATRGRGEPASQAQRVQEIAAGLHCPICKDLSVADSPAPLAQQMRQEIAQKVSAGQSADQIRASFVAAYGDSVLMTPPRHGVGHAAYYLPLIVVAAGLVIAAVLLRRWLRAPTVDPPDGDSVRLEAPLAAAQRRNLYRAVARLREEEPG
jgi:cytochrome c-type biogenesis protein CcmH